MAVQLFGGIPMYVHSSTSRPYPVLLAQSLEDGYMMVDCVKDARYAHDNKIGGNTFQYKNCNISNVSIVHYSDSVPKEDRKMRRAGSPQKRRRTSFSVYSGAAGLEQNATGRQPPKRGDVRIPMVTILKMRWHTKHCW